MFCYLVVSNAFIFRFPCVLREGYLFIASIEVVLHFEFIIEDMRFNFPQIDIFEQT